MTDSHNAREHYARAQMMLFHADQGHCAEGLTVDETLASAQAHATLALAGAVILTGWQGLPSRESKAWMDLAGASGSSAPVAALPPVHYHKPDSSCESCDQGSTRRWNSPDVSAEPEFVGRMSDAEDRVADRDGD